MVTTVSVCLPSSVGGEVELLHDYGISFEGEYTYKRQDVDASLMGEDLDLNSKEHEVHVVLVKSF